MAKTRLEKMYFCSLCDKMVPTEIKTGPTKRTFKGETFELTVTERVCESGHRIHDQSLDIITYNILVAAFEERLEMKLTNIKSIRLQYGLSDVLFAKLLGIERLTLNHFETGKLIPENDMATLLKELREPKALARHYFSMKEQLSVRERGLIEAGLRRTSPVYAEVDFLVEYAHVVGMEKALAIQTEGSQITRIKRKRRKLQFSQEELADLLSVPLETIKELEAGMVRPDPELMGQIGTVLELDFSK